MATKYGMRIVLNDATEITAPDVFVSEELAIDQMSNYATTGYYSRVRKTYYPPSQIANIQLTIEEQNKI